MYRHVPNRVVDESRANEIIKEFKRLRKLTPTGQTPRFFVKNRAGGRSLILSANDIDFIVLGIERQAKYSKHRSTGYETWISTQKAADILGVSRPHFVNRFVKTGQIKSVKFGRHYRVRYYEISRIVEGRRLRVLKELEKRIRAAEEKFGPPPGHFRFENKYVEDEMYDFTKGEYDLRYGEFGRYIQLELPFPNRSLI